MRRAAAVITIVLISLLGACGGSDDTGSGGGSPGSPGSSDASDGGKALDACEALSTDEVGAILGGTVTAEKDPSGGCQFNDPDDPRAPSASIFAVVGAGGGFEASKGGNVTSGKVEDVADIGDGAWVAVGTFSGDSLQGQGAAAVGDQLINVSLLQGKGLDEATVRTAMVELLKLAASKA